MYMQDIIYIIRYLMQRDDPERDSHASLIENNQQKRMNLNQTTDHDDGATLDNDLQKRRNTIKWSLIGGAVLIVVILAIALPIALSGKDEPHPHPVDPVLPPLLPNSTNEYFFQEGSLVKGVGSVSGQIIMRKPVTHLLGEAASNFTPKIGLDWNQTIRFGKNNLKAEVLNYTFDMVSMRVARLMLTDGAANRYSIPKESVPKPDADQNLRLDMVGFRLHNDSAFAFSFQDNKDNNRVVLDTRGQNLVFADKYIQMDMLLPSQRQYGFGERTRPFKLGEGAFGMWANGVNGLEDVDNGRGRGGEYGVHPFVLVQTRKPQEYVGIFFRNSNAQLPIIRFNDTKPDQTVLSYISLGGQLEVYFFVFGSAKQMIQEYHRVIGRPQLPPFWSLGWHEATIKDLNQDKMYETIQNYSDQGLPLEVVYIEKPKSSNVNFAISEFSNLPELRDKLTKKNQRLVNFLDASIYASSDDTERAKNEAYGSGDKAGVFIKTTYFAQETGSKLNNNLVGYANSVEKQQCVYIDWFNDNTRQWWQDHLQAYTAQVQVDGLWTSGNEPYSGTQGEVNTNGAPPNLLASSLKEKREDYYDKNWYKTFDEGASSTFYLPFTPDFQEHGPFDNYSISLNASHAHFKAYNPITKQVEERSESEYNLHNLYGHAMMNHTYQAMLQIQNDKRPFLLTRSTFASTGRFASYAFKPKYRTWDHLQYTIPHMMNMNMFGIPHSGADVCGFYEMDNTVTSLNEELCLRWLQLATFFPLARHSQDFQFASFQTGPLGFKERKQDAQATMHDRMQYLRLMYTCLFEASEFGGSCFDPIFFHYPMDLASYQDEANTTFIYGNAIKVSPIVTAQNGSTTFKSHFPAGRWVNLANTAEVLVADKDGVYDLSFGSPTVQKHLRPGSLIPFQLNSDKSMNTTADLLKAPINLIVNRDTRRVASGTVFLDGGSSLQELTDKKYEYYTIEHKSSKSLQFMLSQGTRGAQDSQHTLGSVKIADAADLKDTDFACVLTLDGGIQDLDVTAADSQLVLAAKKFYEPLKFSQISNIVYGTKGKDVNLCRMDTYEYSIPAEFDLAKALDAYEASIPLVHEGGVLPKLTLKLKMWLPSNIINVQWTWAEQPQDKRVHPQIPVEVLNTTSNFTMSSLLSQHLSITKSPFTINFTRLDSTGKDTYLQLNGLIYDSYLNWVGLRAFTETQGDQFRGVLGLGERSQSKLFYEDGVYSAWAADEGTKPEDGQLPGKHVYGVHPFFMYQHRSTHWVGVFSKQAAAQDWVINNQPDKGEVALKQISTGGLSEFFIIFGAQTPDSVVQKYHLIVGRPVLLPQWALGWHQCKWCLRNLTEYQNVVAKYRENGIPLDAQWADIDYMDQYRPFTVDRDNFGGLKQYVDSLFHNETGPPVKFVPIIDPGVAFRPNVGYRAFDRGVEMNVFLKAPGSESELFAGRVWPNEAVFPDFTHPNASKWWSEQLTHFQQEEIWFDGLWLDMNEAANFCNGPCLAARQSEASQLDQLIYTPTGRSLQHKSLPVDIRHASGVTELDAHSYFGTMQSALTHQWFVSTNAKRPFIVERSSFAGLGKYAGKWLGDSQTSYDDMRRSVTGSMMMGVFGIPFVGGDICGFTGNNTNPELCARWHQVGAFQPFSRNHRDCNGKPQEPYRFKDDMVPIKGGQQISVMDIMKQAILTKYSLIRYYYTYMWLLSNPLAEATVGGSLYKPLFFEYPNDPLAYKAEPSENVMIGASLKLSVSTTPLNASRPDEDGHEFYFPPGRWCDVLHPETLCIGSPDGLRADLPAHLNEFQLHLRQGHIVPLQNASALNISASEDLKKHRVDFHIHPENKTTSNTSLLFTASGIYLNDDGVTPAWRLESNFTLYKLLFTFEDTVNDQSNDETIRLQIATPHLATAIWNNETNCALHNMNDLLGDIYIYDPSDGTQPMFHHTKYFVELVRKDQSFQELGLMRLDEATDRMVYSWMDAKDHNPEAEFVCLNFVKEIRFKPSIM